MKCERRPAPPDRWRARRRNPRRTRPGADDSHAHFVRQRADLRDPASSVLRDLEDALSGRLSLPRRRPGSHRLHGADGVSPDGAQARVHRRHARGGSQLQRARAEAQGEYHDYVANELVDYVDSHYRTIATKEARAIAGLSMGGRIASMTGLTHARSVRRRRRVQPGAATGRGRRRARRSRQRRPSSTSPAGRWTRCCPSIASSWVGSRNVICPTTIEKRQAWDTPGCCGTNRSACSSICSSRAASDQRRRTNRSIACATPASS